MANGLNPQRPDKLSLIVFSQCSARVHYALVMASATAAISTPVTIFFTMEATKALGKPDENGAYPWQAMPAEGYSNGGEMNAAFIKKGVADFETLLSACGELGVKFMVCEMGLRAIDMTRSDLRDDINIETGGVVTFMDDASNNGSMVFI
ncbi:MAG: DsrE/DsrF/DrsH-like family protein [Rhodospirillaceae bacterium]|nr:DsrE/DsrF/DrsH-like family protein [Rhodospirillaceae bacterium]